MHVHLNARRWFERTNGNTYHTVAVLVDGEHVGTSGVTYGYGTHYLHTAGTVLADAGLLQLAAGSDDPYDLSEHRTPDGVTVTTDVVDVTRKRDLHREVTA